MVVVFDEEKAVERTKAFRWKQRFHGFAYCVITAIAFMAVLGFAFVIFSAFPRKVEFIAAGIVAVVMIFYTSFIRKGDPEPEPLVAYRLAMQGKKFLDVKVEDHFIGWQLEKVVFLVVEDSNGVVETVPLCIAKYLESTRHKEETFDLDAGVIYVPYEQRKKG